MNEEAERKRQEEINRKVAAENAIAQAEKMKNDLLIIKREYKIVPKLLDEKRKTESLNSVSGRNKLQGFTPKKFLVWRCRSDGSQFLSPGIGMGLDFFHLVFPISAIRYKDRYRFSNLGISIGI